MKLKILFLVCLFSFLGGQKAVAQTASGTGVNLATAGKISLSCQAKYKEGVLKALGAGSSVANVSTLLHPNVTVDSGSMGMPIGKGKCGCQTNEDAYLATTATKYDDPNSIVSITCANGTNPPHSLNPSAFGLSMDRAWCDNCFEKEVVGQVSGTCGCPQGFTASIKDGVVFCYGSDGQVFSRQDGMEFDQSVLKYLADISESKYYSSGGVLDISASYSQSGNIANGEPVVFKVSKVVGKLDLTECQSQLDESLAMGQEAIDKMVGGKTVVKGASDTCYYRSPAGEDYEVSDKYQAACKNLAENAKFKKFTLTPVKLNK